MVTEKSSLRFPLLFAGETAKILIKYVFPGINEFEDVKTRSSLSCTVVLGVTVASLKINLEV